MKPPTKIYLIEAGSCLFAFVFFLTIILTLDDAKAHNESKSALPIVISSDPGWTQANSTSISPSISADGRYVAFASNASNLDAGEIIMCNFRGYPYACPGVFLKDVQSGAVTRVSTDSEGNLGNSDSLLPSVSADGRHVSFCSNASNLVYGDTNLDYDIFVKDLMTGIVMRASTDASGAQRGDSNTYWFGGAYSSSSISADGRYVAFESRMSNLVPGDSNFQCRDSHLLRAHCSDIYLKDTLSGVITRVSSDSSGNEAVGTSWSMYLSGNPSISADGRFVAFDSMAMNLEQKDANSKQDIFVKDSQTGVTTLISKNSSGDQANDHSGSPAITAEGRYVAFASDATNLVIGDTAQCEVNGNMQSCADIFLKDTQTGQVVLVSTDASGNPGNGDSYDPSISADGRFVAFWSAATNLAAGDTNGKIDVFVKDMLTGRISLVSNSVGGQPGDWDSFNPSIDADGKYVAFESHARNLVTGDTNAAEDVFLAFTDFKTSYWPWYDSNNPAARNWLLMANTGGSSRNLGFGIQIAGRQIDISPFALTSPECTGGQCTPGEIPSGMAVAAIFPGVAGGPVKASVGGDGPGMLTSQRILWGDSLEEVAGTPEERLSYHYYWPWYDDSSPGFSDWVMVANPNYATVFYQIRIGGEVMDSGSLEPGESLTPTFPDVLNGPVEVQAWSDQVEGSSPAKVIASQRVLSDNGRSLSETPGIPEQELSDHYMWTWYDSGSLGAQDWVLVANPGLDPIDYTVRIAGNVVASGTLEAAGSQQGTDMVELSFPGLRGGPVELTATGNAIASQRSLWGNSLEETPGYPCSLLASDYHWTWYDNKSGGATNWMMLANPGTASVDYIVKIGGSEIDSGTLEPAGDAGGGDVATLVYPTVMGGPVEVATTGGTVLASQRVLWKGRLNEMLGTALD